jgi:hypothetical protein
MAAVRALASSSASRVWLGDKSAYPIIAVIGGAVALCAGTCTHYLTHSPDVQWNKGDRASTVRMNFAEGSRWSSHKPGLALPRDEVSNIGVMPGLNKTFGK